MNCPTCQKPMIVLEIEQVEVDYCVKCHGAWLDAGELELLLEGAERRDDVMAEMKAVDVSDEPVRKCPICDKKMEHVRCVGTNGDVIIDKCKANDGLWFDSGELADVIHASGLPQSHKVFELMEEIFGSSKQ